MKRRLSKRLSVVQAPFRSSSQHLGAADRLHPRALHRCPPAVGHGTLRQRLALLHRATAWHQPQLRPQGPASPVLGSRLGQGCKSVNILFIISITLLHYSSFNSLLFYY